MKFLLTNIKCVKKGNCGKVERCAEYFLYLKFSFINSGAAVYHGSICLAGVWVSSIGSVDGSS
jgi:hypothetical protein